MFVKIIYFLFFVPLGVAVLKYRKNVYEWTGQWYWAEKWLWRWGTVVVIILTWLAMIFFWVGYPLWAFEGLRGGNGPIGTPPGLERNQSPTGQDAPADAGQQ